MEHEKTAREAPMHPHHIVQTGRNRTVTVDMQTITAALYPEARQYVRPMHDKKTAAMRFCSVPLAP